MFPSSVAARYFPDSSLVKSKLKPTAWRKFTLSLIESFCKGCDCFFSCIITKIFPEMQAFLYLYALIPFSLTIPQFSHPKILNREVLFSLLCFSRPTALPKLARYACLLALPYYYPKLANNHQKWISIFAKPYYRSF